MWLFLLIPRCWRGSPQRKLWKTGLHLSWTPWNTETGWDETDECAVWRGGAQLNCVFHPRRQCCCADASLLSFASQARLWVQLMKELRQGVKLKKVQEQPFNPLPTEFSLTPFEMLMQDIRARNFQLRKVMVRDETSVAPTTRHDWFECSWIIHVYTLKEVTEENSKSS